MTQIIPVGSGERGPRGSADVSRARLRVASDSDSEPRLFVLRAVAPGDWPVTVRAYLDGRPVGEQTMVIRVGPDPGAEPVRRSAGIMTLRAGPGDLTLQIDEHGTGYRCTLFHTGDAASHDAQTIRGIHNDVSIDIKDAASNHFDMQRTHTRLNLSGGAQKQIVS